MILETILFLVCFGIVFSSLAFGAVYHWGRSILIVGWYSLLLVVWAVRLKNKTAWQCPKPILWIIVGLIFWLVLQYFLPRNYTIPVSPTLAPYIQEMQIPQEIPVQFNSHRGFFTLLQWIIPFSSFLIMPELLKTRRHIYLFIGCITALASFQGWYGLSQYFLADVIPLLNLPYKEQREFHVSGSYLNYNTYACFLALGFILSLGICSTLFFQKKRRSSIEDEKILKNKGLWRKIYYIILALSMFGILAGLFLSLSRGGIICLISGILGFLFFLRWNRLLGSHFWVRIAQLGGLMLITLLFYWCWIGLDPWTEKWGELPDNVQGRLLLWQASWDIFLDHPWFGIGPGSYRYAIQTYMPYDTYRQIGPVIYAHQDYLQFLIEYGSITTALLGAGLFLWAKTSWRIFRKRESLYPRLLWCAAAASLIPMYVHGLFDFSWHIPSQFLLASSIMGSLLARAPTKETK